MITAITAPAWPGIINKEDKTMADIFKRVNPGDLITADLINTIMEELNMVAAPGKVRVPKLFGYSLSQAKSILTAPSVGLVTGVIIATDGQRIYPENRDALEMPVLNQVPVPGEVATVGSSVDILIAAQVSEDDIPTVPEHSVTGMNPPDGARANQRVIVIGENFQEPYHRNTVYFDELYGTTPKLGSSTTGLIVDVPPNIPGLPKDVKVAVQSYGVTKYLPKLYAIETEAQEPELKIESWEPLTRVRVGETLNITGSGFSDNYSENKITFIYRPKKDLTFTVNGKSINDAPGDLKTVSLTVPDFPKEMSPATTGTQYDVTIHIGDDTTHVAMGMNIQIRPKLT
jgi:hypothetical protein